VHVLGICTWAATEQFPSLDFPFFSAFPRFTRFWVNWVSTGSFAGASFSPLFYPVKLIGFVRFNCWQGNAGKLFMRIGANFNVCRLTTRYVRSPKIRIWPQKHARLNSGNRFIHSSISFIQAIIYDSSCASLGSVMKL